MASDSYNLGLGMLGTTAGLSSVMGVTLTMAIGGKWQTGAQWVQTGFLRVGSKRLMDSLV